MAEGEKQIENREEQIVLFQLADQIYGIDISSVVEIIRMERITKVPHMPHFVEGVINLRGKIIPVIDLCKRFGLEQMEETGSSRVIIVNVASNTVGMIVDGVSEVLRIPLDSIDPPPSMIHGIDATYLRGIAILEEQLVILLNLEKVLYDYENQELQRFVDETA